MSDVEAFCQNWGLQDITDTVKRGALVAQDPAHFEDVPGLTAYEREQLTREVTHKWSQPAAMYYTVILCSVGAAVQGWDQVGQTLTSRMDDDYSSFLLGRKQRC